MANNKINIENYNDDFLIIKSDRPEGIADLGRSIFKQDFDFVSDVIVTEAEICVKLNSHFEKHHLLSILQIESKKSGTIKTHKLPVYFNYHKDWSEVESISGYKRQHIIEKIVATKFCVSMFGFLPGFMYLTGLETGLQVPRKKTPSKYVDAGSIAIGGKYMGLYSIDSPGGWHVIGSTPVSILDLKELPPVEMNLKDKIKLVEINEEEYNELLKMEITVKDYNEG